jgi:hypothetical protein
MKHNNISYKLPDKYSHIDFNSLGFRKTTDLEIAKGRPPFIFDIFKHDNPACSTAKSLYNSSSEQLFNANQDYLSALEPFIQTMALTHTMNGSMKTIATHCVPKGYKL